MQRSTRRAFMTGLGATTAAATFLRPILAQTQTGLAPQRLLMIHRPCGSVMDTRLQSGAPSAWWPTSARHGSSDWVVAPGGLIDSFSAVRESMVIVKGLHCPRLQEWNGDQHGAGMVAMISPSPADPGTTFAWPMLPGHDADQADANTKAFTATDRSIDQLLLTTIPTLTSPAAIPSISLTPDLASAQTQDFCLRAVSYSKNNPNAAHPTPLHPQADPQIAFADIFGTRMGDLDADALARLKAQNKSVIDFIAKDLSGLRPKLPKLAKDKVDAHLDSIRQLEQQLNSAGSGVDCKLPVIKTNDTPTSSGTSMDGDVDPVNDARYHQAALDQLAIIKTAFACDLTRVASFTFGWGNSGIRFSNVIPSALPDVPIADVEGYHAISHDAAGATDADPHEAQFAIDKYFCYMTAKLLQELAATPDVVSGGSLLDNTLVVFWNECSVGNTHDTRNIPALLFGGKFLKLQTGRYFDFSGKSGGQGRYMSDFWVQLSQAWASAEGVAGTGYEALSRYGAPEWNLGDMSDLFG